MMNEVKDLVGKISQSNHYLVSFSALNPQITEHLGEYLGIRDPIDFLSRKSGLLCSEAVLPTTSYATGEVKDNFMGIPQEFAHTRLYTDIDFSFYIDTDYTNLRIFEGWMDFISSGSLNEIGELTDNYYKRYRYPDEYKVQTMFISKFEKNISSQIDYQFINTFPKTMTTIPVSYGDAELLKVTVTFNYDRYVVNPKGSYTASNLSAFSDIERTLFRSFDRNRIASYASDSRKEFKSSEDPKTIQNELIKNDTAKYGNTDPKGSFNITNSATNAEREVEAQIHNDTAKYGNTVPDGSLGGVGSKETDRSPHLRPERKQFANTRSGAKAYEKALKNWKAQYGPR